MKKLLFISLFVFSLFADSGQSRWTIEDGKRQTWFHAVMLCAENGDRLPDYKEIASLDENSTFDFWDSGLDYFKAKGNLRKTKCVSDSNKTRLILDLQEIDNTCIMDAKANKEAEVTDSNKSFGEKAKDVANNVVDGAGRATDFFIGLAGAFLTKGSSGDSVMKTAISGDDRGFPKISKEICEEAHNKIAHIGK